MIVIRVFRKVGMILNRILKLTAIPDDIDASIEEGRKEGRKE